MTPAVSDTVWSAQDTTPPEIAAAVTDLLIQLHAENPSYTPARVLNLVCIVDHEWSGEVANRLRGVGRYHASRTIVCAVEPGRQTLDATASVAADVHPRPGEFTLTRETVIVKVGPEHLEHLDTVVDPLVVTDLTTVVWSPHGHHEAVDALLGLAQVVLLDSVDEPDTEAALHRPAELSQRAYVVDLAWLRSTPWRERIAATFDPPQRLPELERISGVTIRHHPDSGAAGLLLVGWLASRLGWQPAKLTPRGSDLLGKLHARKQDVAVTLTPVPQPVRGLAGITVETAAGWSISLDRGEGGLRAVRRDRKGSEQTWTVLGASRGEAGIFGEGIRQALLRDPTYDPALACANALVD
jgi:glucose-6-phosphate dehydrogenase assembly protein OpcA